MWKMSRAGSSSLSPDGTTLLYAQTDYNMAQNRGVTTIWVQDMASGAVTRLTDTASNNADPKWSADGRKIYFLSDRSGSMQVWRMNAASGDATQVTGSGGGEGVPDVEGFGVSPDEKHIWWVQAVQTARRKSSDVYEDMDKSKARIYDDLMARHWDYWDEGSYRHIFIGELGKGLVTGGTDIMPMPFGTPRWRPISTWPKSPGTTQARCWPIPASRSPAPNTPFRPTRTSSSMCSKAA